MLPSSRKFTGDYPGYIRGHYRKPPEDVDWTRRYLRRRRIPCEGGALGAALDSLDGAAWERMKAAWRKRREKASGPWATMIDGICKEGKRLGPVWERLISWGVIGEAEAHELASVTTSSGYNFYGDSGAKFYLATMFGEQLERLEKARRGRDEHLDRVGVTLALEQVAREDPDRATMDERACALLEGRIRMPRPIALRHLDELKASGD
jgi:hypothetical protein